MRIHIFMYNVTLSEIPTTLQNESGNVATKPTTSQNKSGNAATKSRLPYREPAVRAASVESFTLDEHGNLLNRQCGDFDKMKNTAASIPTVPEG